MLEKIFQKKYLYLYEIIGAILVFTAIYFIVIFNASSAFEYDKSQELFDNKMRLIEIAAQIYGDNNLSLFKEKNTIYITISELAKEGYILPDDEDGNVKDPTSNVKLLNDYKIRLTYENEQMQAKVLNP